MKTLVLVRHAKSSWADGTLPDRNRPLDVRGEKDVAKMAKRLSQHSKKPDLIVTSPAVRALETAKVIATALDCGGKRVVVNDRLYAGTADDLIDLVAALDDDLKRVMLVGHNPEFTDLAHRLASQITHLPTCAVATFRFDTQRWSDIGRIEPVEVDVDTP